MTQTSTPAEQRPPIGTATRVDLLKAQLPFDVKPTNVPGVFTPATPPPAEFDPNTASSDEFIRNGLLLRRPVRGKDSPGVVDAWNQVFSRTWLPEDRIEPHLEPKIGVTHRMRRPGSKTNAGYTDDNWAGGMLKGPWFAAFGTWTVPTVSEPREPQGSFVLLPPPLASFDGNSAEWIMEAPDGGEPTSALPNFTTLTFTSAFACATSGPAGDPKNGDTINVVRPHSGSALTSTTLASDSVQISFIG